MPSLNITASDLQAHRSVPGRSAIAIGIPSADGNHTALNGAPRTVGAVEGTVDISPNQEIVKLQSSALLNSYSVLETGFDYQITFNLLEFDIWNIALALSYNADTTAGSSVLVLGEVNQSSLRTLRIRHYGAINASGDAQLTADFEFWKVKIVSNGGLSFDRTGAVMLPVTAHALGNDSDSVGRYTTSTVDVANRQYEVAVS